jgi:hypothetical protein
MEPKSQAVLVAGAFSGKDAFRQHVRDILAMAVVQQWPSLILSDPDFLDWPLGEKAVVKSLNDWSKKGHRITLLANRFDLVQAHHARFVGWRRTWDTIVSCRRIADKNTDAGLSVVPSGLWTPDWTIQRTSIEENSGICTQSVSRRVEIRDDIDNCLKRSTAGFSASVLGL